MRWKTSGVIPCATRYARRAARGNPSRCPGRERRARKSIPEELWPYGGDAARASWEWVIDGYDGRTEYQQEELESSRCAYYQGMLHAVACTLRADDVLTPEYKECDLTCLQKYMQLPRDFGAFRGFQVQKYADHLVLRRRVLSGCEECRGVPVLIQPEGGSFRMLTGSDIFPLPAVAISNDFGPKPGT